VHTGCKVLSAEFSQCFVDVSSFDDGCSRANRLLGNDERANGCKTSAFYAAFVDNDVSVTFYDLIRKSAASNFRRYG
jgi:hypothetical protein